MAMWMPDLQARRTCTSGQLHGGEPAEEGLTVEHLREKAEQQQNILNNFILMFRKLGSGEDNKVGLLYTYRQNLKQNVSANEAYLEVNYEDLQGFSPQAADYLRTKPLECLPLFEEAAKQAADHVRPNHGLRDFQVQVSWPTARLCTIREVQSPGNSSNNLSILIAVPGIVTKCSPVRQKVVSATIQCVDCKSEVTTQVAIGSFYPQLPKKCHSNGGGSAADRCRDHPYVVRAHKSFFVDTQRIKLQELPSSVPRGELPRHMEVSLDRHLVGRVTPGQCVVIVGVTQIYHDAVKEKGRKAAGIRRRYLRAVGMMLADQASLSQKVQRPAFRSIHGDKLNEFSHKMGTVDVTSMRQYKEFYRRENIYEKIAASIAPQIYGHEDIKKAIACQLFGGTRKHLPDGGRLRGDMNLLLVGDPSTAKSQLLKYAHQCAPIGQYTSGKGSSAAGLTAAVVRDKQQGRRGGEFYLEGGAMVLADGGLVCIDEFDKMREQDTVAIHEAMEQQTISVAKAGISCVLNSRTSVLAAANPSLGCYDPLKSNEEQMSFKASVLSRFDLIFKVQDNPEQARDMQISSHVISIHKRQTPKQQQQGEISQDLLRGYISACRSWRTPPRLQPDAEEAIKNFYVQCRKSTLGMQKSTDAATKGAIQLTVRQLESLVRIAESLAKMRGSLYVLESDAREAIRLLEVSTVNAIETGIIENVVHNAQEDDVEKAQQRLEQVMPLGVPHKTEVVMNLVQAQGVRREIADRVMFIMCRRGELKYQSHKKWVVRTKAS